MAPYASPSPQALIARLQDPAVEAALPLSMGGPAGPTAQFGRLDGQWCLYRLRVDDAAYMAFADARHQAGEPLFPEHRMQFLRPGEVLLRAPSREALLEALAPVEVVLDEQYQVQLRPKGVLGRLLGRGR